MPRGRAKTPKAYGNRTDLNGPMPITAPTGQDQYGARAEQVKSQEALRMGTPDVAKANPLTPIGGPVVEEQVTAEVTAPMQRPTPVPLTAPTQDPNTPVTAGIVQGQTTDPDVLALKTELLPLFRTQAAQPGVPRQFRDFVTWLENV